MSTSLTQYTCEDINTKFQADILGLKPTVLSSFSLGEI